MPENSKQKILSTATKLFAKKGFDAVSIREICKKANVNICMISYYFGGKKELYQAIIDELIERQTEYAKTFINLDEDLTTIPKKQQIQILMLVLDKFIEFFYNNITTDVLIFLLKEQHNPKAKIESPAFKYLRRLIACIFDKKENDREIIFKTLFIISQINSPRLLPLFSLKPLGQDDFTQKDIKIIKENLKLYVNVLLKEAKVD